MPHVLWTCGTVLENCEKSSSIWATVVLLLGCSRREASIHISHPRVLAAEYTVDGCWSFPPWTALSSYSPLVTVRTPTSLAVSKMLWCRHLSKSLRSYLRPFLLHSCQLRAPDVSLPSHISQRVNIVYFTWRWSVMQSVEDTAFRVLLDCYTKYVNMSLFQGWMVFFKG